jgi:hypothetical protein
MAKKKILIPHKKYIQALMVNQMSSQALIQDLQSINLPIPHPPTVVKNIYNDLYKLNPDYFEAGDPKEPGMDWLEKLGIDSLYAYKFNVGIKEMDPGIKGAFKILDDPLMRRAIQALAFAKVNNEDIELIVNGKFDIGYASEDFEAFLNYFFNVSDWNYNDRVEFIQQETSQDSRRFYKLALEGDKPYLMWKLGLAPSRSFDDMLKEMFNDSFFNFKERMRHDPELAQRWGQLAVKLSDKIDKLEKDDNNREEFFQSLEFETDSFDQRDNDKIVNMNDILEKERPDLPEIDNTMSVEELVESISQTPTTPDTNEE